MERWKQAQAAEFEYWRDQGADGSDWNEWWFEKFEGYKAVPWDKVGSILEVGCGPFAKNLRNILERYGPHRRIGLNDPLLFEYAATHKFVRHLIHSGAYANGGALEYLEAPTPFEALICVNVLDHVRDVTHCFYQIETALAPGGYLILGQDLTNEEDCRQCPDNLTDVKHPILMDLLALMPHIDSYEPVFNVLLPREQGRNPKAHYGTLLFIGKKVK